jgi:acyl-CoA thioester hydrolase
MDINDFRLRHQLRVRWAEVDKQSIVFNGHYFLYFDVATTEYWRAIGFAYPDGFAALGGDLFAVKADAEFLKPAEFDDVLEIGCRVSQLGRSSITLTLGVFRCEELLTRGNLIYVFASLPERHSAPIPEQLKTAISQFEILPPSLKAPSHA